MKLRYFVTPENSKIVGIINLINISPLCCVLRSTRPAMILKAMAMKVEAMRVSYHQAD